MAANIIFDQYRNCFTLNFDLKMCCIESYRISIYLRIYIDTTKRHLFDTRW